ncbi:MAG: hypothetical protein ACTMIR_15925, partial [Cellulomonadaceae bacterium]
MCRGKSAAADLVAGRKVCDGWDAGTRDHVDVDDDRLHVLPPLHDAGVLPLSVEPFGFAHTAPGNDTHAAA